MGSKRAFLGAVCILTSVSGVSNQKSTRLLLLHQARKLLVTRVSAKSMFFVALSNFFS